MAAGPCVQALTRPRLARLAAVNAEEIGCRGPVDRYVRTQEGCGWKGGPGVMVSP